jgi:multiple sugar transport system ATP-binding protein
VYVTHDQAEAMSLGDRVAVLRSGELVQIGSALSVYDSPSCQFVGGFLGSPPMNFLTATVSSSSLSLGDVSLPAPAFAASWDGRPVLVGVRAEKVFLDPSGVPAVVEVVEPTGASLLLTVLLGGQRLKVSAPPDLSVAPDDTLSLRIDPSSVRLFDPDTALALLPRP